MLRRSLCLSVLLASVVATSAVAATCPLNQFTLGTSVIKSALDVDTHVFTGGGARYSIPVGVMQASSHCTGAGCTSSVDLYVEDLFTVSGPPAGTSVPLVAHLFLDTGTSSSSANIQDTNNHIASIAPAEADYDLTLPIAAVAGTPFQLHFEIACSNVGAALGQVGGTFSFSGLPAGSGISSCHGYLNGTPVPVRESSWGRVKILYR